jgi:hypothetical protein
MLRAWLMIGSPALLICLVISRRYFLSKSFISFNASWIPKTFTTGELATFAASLGVQDFYNGVHIV